jgi:hypothetical protein
MENWEMFSTLHAWKIVCYGRSQVSVVARILEKAVHGRCQVSVVARILEKAVQAKVIAVKRLRIALLLG